MDISFTIKSLRQAGLTQTQIGNAIGLRQTSISDMESGKAGTKRPSFQVIDGLARLAKKHKVATEPPAPQPQ
ncbi:helix-turn-helix domain-containing protein [Massilia oculi]|uniref:Transcriptional regulator n=1 Tax=Massilia oculi TaxID=945844 RepID=A0A2S2DRD1_9BURK|nr:helix-turn-helix transcriptional regulator [Massilia oculi]AWL07589.1 transcriptional regulator [Massilia oculi]